jgi:hypothetical protein
MYKHLHEDMTILNERDRFVPVIPHPFKATKRLTILGKVETYHCACAPGADFDNIADYRQHYRTEQLIELNQLRHHEVHRARDMAKIKATYWRRRAFVMEHGDESSVYEMKQIETPELHGKEEIMALLARVTDVWAPVYREWAEHNDVTVGQVKDDTSIEDETPEDPAHGN